MDANSENKKNISFSNKQLLIITLPLILEQLLGVMVGVADTMMVSTVGESAVSGVSLVDTINILLVSVFMSMSTGGYVVISQALGRNDNKKACESSNQMVLIITLVAVIVMIFSLLFNRILLNSIFGNVEKDVMDNAVIYFYLTALSYPFLAVHSACSSIFRSIGKNKVTLYVSILLNIINVSGNLLFIVGFGWNAMGAGLSTLIARSVSATLLFILALNEKNIVHLSNPIKWRFNSGVIRKIMKISVPTSVDGIVFQVGKLLLQGLIVTFGTSAIAANAIAGTIAGFACIPGNAIGIVLIMVTGQLVGAKQFDKVTYYTKKLVTWGNVAMGLLNVIVIVFVNQIVGLYNLTPEGSEMTKNIILLNCVMSTLFWSLSFVLPNSLRAANDARYTMIVSIVSMWLCRILFSYILCLYFGMGVIGVWVAMGIDWMFRGACFVHRFKSRKWIAQSM